MIKQNFQLPENMSPQSRNAFFIAIAIASAHFIAVLYYLYLLFTGQVAAVTPFLMLIAVSVALGVIFLVSSSLSWRGQPVQGAILMLGILALSYPPIALLVTGLGTVLGIALMFVGPMSAHQVLPRRPAWIMTILTVLSGLATFLVDVFGSTARPSLPGIFIPLLATTVVFILGFLIVRQFRNYSLRTKFLVSILSATGLSVLVFGFYAVYSYQQNQNFMIGQLETAVLSQARQLLNGIVETEARDSGTVFETVAQEVKELADYQAALYAQSPVLEQGAYWDGSTRLMRLPGGHYGNSKFETASVVVPSIATLTEAMIADINTNIYLDFTAPATLQSNSGIIAVYFVSVDGYSIYYPNINLSEVTPPDFDPRVQSFFTVATPKNNPDRKVVWTEPYQDPAGQGLLVTSAAPVYDKAGRFRGVVAADMRLIDITESISAIKVGQSGFAFMVDSTGRIIGMPEAGYKMFDLAPETVQVNETPTQTILGLGPVELQEVTRQMTAGETGLETFTIGDQPFFVSYTFLPSVGYSLGLVAPSNEIEALYLETRDQVEREAQATIRLAIIILIGVLLAAAGASLFISQLLSGPIVRLTAVAEQVTAGNMEVQAKAESTDETGTLANAFNRMTAQLRDFIATLESRVAERTQNLELAAEVGRTVSQVGDLKPMLEQAANLILERFDLYYVQVYLADPDRATLVLEAGTGAVGTQLLERGHRLQLNTGSINGRAAVERRPVVISDTAGSLTFRPNPLLPETRGEMALPLIVGEKVVGVLDLQARDPGVLTEELLPAFEALAGQLAVAIQNATLLEEAQQARAEVEAQARRLVRKNWDEHLDAIHKPEQLGFVFDHDQVAPLQETDEFPDESRTVSAPISLTGETLGSLVVEVGQENKNEQTGELVNIVARQVAQQIENLRLLESAERYRYDAEQAARRQTRDGWQEYINAKSGESLGYLYDLKEVRPHSNGHGTDESALTLPLKVRDEAVGKLSIQGLTPDDNESFELASAVAERLSAHIESLRQYAQTQSALAQSEKLFDASRSLTQATDLQELVAATVNTLDIPEVNRAVLTIFDYDSAGDIEQLTIIANWWNETGHEITPIGTRYPLQVIQAMPMFVSPTPVFFNDTFHDERVDATTMELVKKLNLRAVAVLPLHAGSKQIGALILEAEEPHSFTPDETRLFISLAPQIATVLENRQQYERAQRQAERETMLNTISQKIQGATSVEAVLQIAARELGHALGAPMTIAQLSMKDQN